jgi:D-xylose 1-dehydrogenase (NADP+, D-xylono-1,5-lactone-forming)
VSRRSVAWGVLGAAAINDALIPGLLAASNATFLAIASRRPGIAEREARRWGAPVAHPSYDALLADDRIDAVYIPLSNDEHADWTVRALDAGKHVLCEKPLGLSEDEVERISDAARRARRLALEAFMYRFTPRWRRAGAILAEGLIGEPRVVRVGFAFKQHPPGYNIRFDPAVGGGIVWDMGCYAVNMSRDLFGAEPRAVVAMGYTRAGAGVETSVEATLSFGEGRSAVTHVSFDYPNPYSQIEVIGTEGWVSMPGTGMRREPFTRLLWHNGEDEVFAGGVEPVVESFPFVDPYRLEVEHLSDCILHDRPIRYGLDDAIANVRALTAILRALEEGCVVAVG